MCFLHRTKWLKTLSYAKVENLNSPPNQRSYNKFAMSYITRKH